MCGEIDEYLENCFYKITNRIALGIGVKPQYLKFTEPVDAQGYYKDVFNYFNPDPIEIIDETTDDTDDNHYPECDRYLLNCGACRCLDLLLTKYLDTEDSNKENKDPYINSNLEKYFDTRMSLGLQSYD